MDIDKVRELVKLVEDSGIEELEVSHGETTIRIQKSRILTGAAAVAPVPIFAPAEPVAVAPVAAAAVASPDEGERAKWQEIRSPIVGTFYKASAPTADPFISIGDRIQPGQPLCIVEAMKVMNEIESEVSGVIKEILVEDGQPVEAEAVLFLVDPS